MHRTRKRTISLLIVLALMGLGLAQLTEAGRHLWPNAPRGAVLESAYVAPRTMPLGADRSPIDYFRGSLSDALDAVSRRDPDLGLRIRTLTTPPPDFDLVLAVHQLADPAGQAAMLPRLMELFHAAMVDDTWLPQCASQSQTTAHRIRRRWARAMLQRIQGAEDRAAVEEALETPGPQPNQVSNRHPARWRAELNGEAHAMGHDRNLDPTAPTSTD